MIDVLTEELIDFRQAAKTPPFRNSKTGKPCHIACLYRYVMLAAAHPTGNASGLKPFGHPSGQRTSREAIVRFIAALTSPDTPVPVPTSATRRRQIEQAEKELADAGML